MLSPSNYMSGSRPSPSMKNGNDEQFSSKQKCDAIGRMRVNHCGEVCAQALYLGQAITARNKLTKDKLQHAANEEIEHLSWCATRIQQLGGKPSILNPLWFIGSFTIGTIAGIAGDKWSLGFLAETEKQVGAHLQNHIDNWPKFDTNSLAILKQMHIDELDHANTAINCGATPLPSPIPAIMRYSAKIMTRTTFYI